MEPPENAKVIVTPIAKIWLDDDGIIRQIIHPNIDVTIDGTKETTQAIHKLTQGKAVPVFVEMRNIKSTDQESRKYVTGKEAQKVTKCHAMLIGSPVSRMIGNFCVGLNKPSYPTKLFTNEEKAIKWLKQFK